MNYSYNLFSNTPLDLGKGDSSTKSSRTFIPARVVDVILDDNHPEWDKLGRSEALGAIKYRVLNTSIVEEDPEKLPTAFPLVSSFKTLPLKNEIVLLLVAPSGELDSSNLNSKVYYHTIVNLWNHPNHGGFPQDTDSELELGDGVEELTDVNPLQPFAGDVIIDGRNGQSLRFTGFPSNKNPFTDQSNNGLALTILSNGQKPGNQPFDSVVEDINEDSSSIYLTSDHKIPLKQVRDKTNSYGFNKKPIKADQFKGSQVMVNSGRLYFSAKEDGIFFNSNQFLELQSNIINLDAENEVSIDGKLIFLGKDAANAPQSIKEPALLGNQTAIFLNSVVNIVKEMATAMQGATTVDGKKVPLLNKRGIVARKMLDTLLKDIPPFGTSPLKSKKVFVE